jgi:hypothetical protein
MSVKILPCLIAFVGGAAKDKCGPFLRWALSKGRTSRLTVLAHAHLRILGFEDFAPVASKPDDFPTSALELRLKSSGASALEHTRAAVMT